MQNLAMRQPKIGRENQGCPKSGLLQNFILTSHETYPADKIESHPVRRPRAFFNFYFRLFSDSKCSVKNKNILFVWGRGLSLFLAQLAQWPVVLA